jgi:hypothetical protein
MCQKYGFFAGILSPDVLTKYSLFAGILSPMGSKVLRFYGHHIA